MDERDIDDSPNETSSARVTAVLTREELYQLVWAEPMLKLAERYGVSSSYLARVCTTLHVPRPPRGYWAKRAVGIVAKQPTLPPARPGDETFWSRDGRLPTTPQAPAAPQAKAESPSPRSLRIESRKRRHALVVGAREHFGTGRTSYEAEYLKPAKRLLVDLAVTKNGLDRALEIANELFVSLEARGHRVVIAANGERLCRHEVDEREKPTRGNHFQNLWSPFRCTVVYVGTVAIGLTIIEMSEEVPVRYVKGEYVRESEYVPPKHTYGADHTWTTTKAFATGRFCLQAYSPYPGAKWVHHWRESKPREIDGLLHKIVDTIEAAAPDIVKLIEAELRRQKLEREKWDEDDRRRRAAERVRREENAVKESKEELLLLFQKWTEARQIQQFVEEIEAAVLAADEATRPELLERLQLVKEFLGRVDVLERLKSWKTPKERLGS
ncbi:conserved protein of unknown function [Pararobbsia alpina]|uniref:hypothetical protein n=1 Tax=Pararobbsia alpina TaxID=621374 RepID=UPI0039A58E98